MVWSCPLDLPEPVWLELVACVAPTDLTHAEQRVDPLDLWNGYSAAETSGYATLGRVEGGRPVTIGRPLANTRTYVVDAQGRPVPLGVPENC